MMPEASKSNSHGYIHGIGVYPLSTPAVLKKILVNKDSFFKGNSGPLIIIAPLLLVQIIPGCHKKLKCIELLQHS